MFGGSGATRPGMTENPHVPPTVEPPVAVVGARLRTDVDEAHRDLERAAAPYRLQTQYARGVLAVYVWALGATATSPVTGTGAGRGAAATASPPCGDPPSLALLTAEMDAAVAQLAQPTRRTVPRDYLRGIHDALAWLCARTERRPMAPSD